MGHLERVSLSASPAGDPAARTTVAELDGRYLSVESATSFTGRVIGLYITHGTALFADYRYTDRLKETTA